MDAFQEPVPERDEDTAMRTLTRWASGSKTLDRLAEEMGPRFGDHVDTAQSGIERWAEVEATIAVMAINWQRMIKRPDLIEAAIIPALECVAPTLGPPKAEQAALVVKTLNGWVAGSPWVGEIPVTTACAWAMAEIVKTAYIVLKGNHNYAGRLQSGHSERRGQAAIGTDTNRRQRRG